MKIAEFMGTRGWGTTLKNLTTDAFKKQQKPNKSGSTILCIVNDSKIHASDKNMPVDLGKNLKLACAGTCWKGYSVSRDVAGLIPVIQNQMQSFNTKCGWVWLPVHLVGV